MLPFCPSPFLNKSCFIKCPLNRRSQYSFPQQNFSHQSSFHQMFAQQRSLNSVFPQQSFLIKVLFINVSLNKDLSIQFFLNRSFFLNKSSTVGRTSPQHISLIVSTSNCYVEIKRMSALWFTFGRVLSDLEGSILGNSTNPLGVRWGRSDSERCSPPSSFPSVHLLTTFPFFTPLMWISPLTFHLFALKRVFSGEFPHLSTTFLSPSAICVQRDTSTFCSSWSTTGFQNHGQP